MAPVESEIHSGGTPGHGASEHIVKFHRGIAQFNAGRFFDAHETWEEIWLPSPEPEKTFLQGIIQIAAAFHHYQRANLRGTRSLLAAGLGRLSSFPETRNGIGLAALRTAAGEWIVALSEGKDPGIARIPKIEPV